MALAPICFPEPRLEAVLFGPRGDPVGGEWLSGLLSATSDQLLLPVLWNATFLPQRMPDAMAGMFPFGRIRTPEYLTA